MGIVTYLALSGSILTLLLIGFRRHIDWHRRTWRIMLLHLLTLTVVFDGLIVALNIVSYDRTKILGLTIGPAPIEDLIYTIAAIAIIPALWNILGKRKKS